MRDDLNMGIKRTCHCDKCGKPLEETTVLGKTPNNAMNILFLDDERYPDEVFWIPHKHYLGGSIPTIVRDAYSFEQEVLSGTKWDVISFDNDIQDNVEGKHLLGWLIYLFVDKKIDYFPTKIILHTMNTVAKNQMLTYLESFAYSYELTIEIVV